MTDDKSAVASLLKQKHWHEERKKLRRVLLGCGLHEAVKWGKLCYSFKGSNVAIIFGLKSYCAVGFLKGSHLSDKKNLLVAPGKHSQAMRQMRFSRLDEIIDAEVELKGYLKKAIQLEKDGAEVEFTEKDSLTYPEELKKTFRADRDYANAFAALTPGRRRGYIMHFADAKQAKTREGRIKKCRAQIMQGTGLHERS